MNGSAALDADAAHGVADRPFGRDMDGVGRACGRARARSSPGARQRQPDFRIARHRQRPELVGREEFDLGAERARLARDVAERAHHAVDLRMPGVGGDQDFHAARACCRKRPAIARPDCSRPCAGLCPGDDLERAVVTLGDRRAAFDPVAAVDVAQAEVVMHGGGVDVAADHAVGLVVLAPRSPAPSRRRRCS